MRFALGAGQVEVADDGAVAAVLHPPGRPMLLENGPGAPEAAMHDPSRTWGKGSASRTLAAIDSMRRRVSGGGSRLVEPALADPLANDEDWALVYALRLGVTGPVHGPIRST